MRSSRWLIGLLVAVIVVLAGALVLSAFDDSDDATEATAPAAGEARIVSAAELSELAAEAPGPVYWLGDRPGSRLELTGPDASATYVRYLGGDAQAGDERDDFVTVATYGAGNGVEEIRKAAEERPRASLEHLDSGAVLMVDPDQPKSVHLAFPGERAQIEVYSPRAGAAEQLASGKLLRQVR